MPITVKDAGQAQAERAAKIYVKTADHGNEEVGKAYHGRTLAYVRTQAPSISGMSLDMFDASQVLVAPDATGLSQGKPIKSYRESTFARGQQIRVRVDHSDNNQAVGDKAAIEVNRYVPDVDHPTRMLPTSTNVANTQSDFFYPTRFQPEEFARFVATVRNIEEPDGISDEVRFQYWSQPTAAISETNGSTTTGNPPIAAHQLILTLTRGGEPVPSGSDLTLTGSDGVDHLNAERAFRYNPRGDNTATIHLVRAITNTPRTVTYTFSVRNNVPGGSAALTASASLQFTWP